MVRKEGNVMSVGKRIYLKREMPDFPNGLPGCGTLFRIPGPKPYFTVLRIPSAASKHCLGNEEGKWNLPNSAIGKIF